MKKNKFILPLVLLGLTSTSLTSFVSCGHNVEPYIEICNLEKQYSSRVGESNQTESISVMFYDKEVSQDVTSSATITLKCESTSEITWNENDKKVAWSKNIDDGEYEFTLSASCEIGEKAYNVDLSSKLIVNNYIKISNLQNKYIGEMGRENKTPPISITFVEKDKSEDVTSLSEITVLSDLPKKITWDKEENVVHWSNDIDAGIYTFTVKATYVNSDQKKYETSLQSQLTINSAKRIEIQELESEYSTKVGEQNKTPPISVWLMEKSKIVGEETKTNITNSASIMLTCESTTEITWNNNDKTINWSNNIDANTYKFTLHAQYEDSQGVVFNFEQDSNLIVGNRQKDLSVDSTSLDGIATLEQSHGINVLFTPEDKAKKVDVTKNCSVVKEGQWPDGIDYDNNSHSIKWKILEVGTYKFTLSITYEGFTKTFDYELVISPISFMTCDWDVLADEASRGLENLHSLFKSDCDGNVDYKGTLIGLTKKIKIGNKEYNAIVIDENHDTIWKTTKKAPLTFMVYCGDIKHCFEAGSGGSNRWEESDLREYLQNDMKNSLDPKIKDRIKHVEKYTHEFGEENPTKYEETLCPLSLIEVNYDGSDQKDEGDLYKYFEVDAEAKRKKLSLSFLRSPSLTMWRYAFRIFRDGKIDTNAVDSKQNVCFTFCI